MIQPYSSNNATTAGIPNRSVSVSSTTTTTKVPPVEETAYDWLLRSRRQERQRQQQQQQQQQFTNTDPSLAAWEFVHRQQQYYNEGNNNSNQHSNHEYNNNINNNNNTVPEVMQGTGISYIDYALSRTKNTNSTTVSSSLTTIATTNQSSTLPVIDIRGECGKTWTLISLVARFVVATRHRSCSILYNYDNHDTYSDTEIDTDTDTDDVSHFPQAFIIDSKLDMTIDKVSYAVRSCLLRELSNSNTNNIIETTNTNTIHNVSTTNDYTNNKRHSNSNHTIMKQLDNDIQFCLRRINYIQSYTNTIDTTISNGYIPVLEILRTRLYDYKVEHPTLVVWDGFLCSTIETDACKMDVIRCIELLLQQCTIFFVSSSDTIYRKYDYERIITHRIYLQKQKNKIIYETEQQQQQQQQQQQRTNETCYNSRTECIATVYGTQIPFSITLSGILS